MNIVALFDSNVRKYPGKPFIRCNGHTVTYGQTQDISRKAAAVLASHGVKAGDTVAVMCYNTPGAIFAMLGAWRLNAVVAPVNHKMQAPEVDYILDHSRARVLVFDGALAPVIRKVSVPVPALATDSAADGYDSFDEALAKAQPVDGVVPDENDLAEILYTSGTTGKAKGCLHSHRTVCQTALTTVATLSMTRDDRTLIAMPIWHSSPLNNWMMGTLYVGGTVVLLREYQPQAFLQCVQDERITLYFGAPVSFTMALQNVPSFGDYDLTSIRSWIYGGGPISAELSERLAEAYRSDRFFQVYGMTETGPGGTTLFPEEQRAKAGSIGRVANPGIDMRVVRSDGGDALPGEIGEIWLKADSNMLGYLDDPVATAQALDGGWYKSGDLARLDEDGYLFLVDRAKDMIITGGENVYSKEVEDAIFAHPDVRDVAVIGRPHPEWGETVIAYIVAAPGATSDAQALKGFLADRLARYKIPRDYIFVDVLPRTPTGKVMKHILRAQATSLA
ncbi:MAG: AMP-binding protein [Pseudomonadota bacterium]